MTTKFEIFLKIIPEIDDINEFLDFKSMCDKLLGAMQRNQFILIIEN